MKTITFVLAFALFPQLLLSQTPAPRVEKFQRFVPDER